ncbi:MAG: hypothetical protein ACXVWU_09670, partial [Nocardioides sp.]
HVGEQLAVGSEVGQLAPALVAGPGSKSGAHAVQGAHPGLRSYVVAAAAEARRLLAEGFEQEQLDDLAGAFPELPGTFNPRALDTGADVTGAEQELAEARDELAEAAQLLRSPGAEDG